MGLHVVLYEPEIPPNTGNISRLCAASATALHLIEPLGFSLADKYLKRAGLDYWQYLDLHIHPSWEDFWNLHQGGRHYYATTKANQPHSNIKYEAEDYLIFGPETRGLPQKILDLEPENRIRIPILSETRSLNLSSSVAIVLYEALRQLNYPSLS